jgi:hypothetical protein
MVQRAFEPGMTLVEEVINPIEPGQPDNNEIDGDDVVEQPRYQQDQNTGNERDQRCDMGGGDDHRLVLSGVMCGKGLIEIKGRGWTLLDINAQTAFRF